MLSKENLKKVPWGIVAGASGMIVFFSTVAFILVYMVLSGVAAQTAESITLFENWYQTLLFVVAIVAFLIFAASLTMWILRATGKFFGSDKEADR